MIKNNLSKKVRFILVGVCNTTIDFSTLFLMRSLGLPTIPANIISTSAAFCFSFFANKKFTFKSSHTSVKQFVLFVLVTLFGLWVIQALVIQGVQSLLASSQLNDTTSLFIAKIIATSASMVWNYVFYSRLIFTHKTDDYNGQQRTL